MGEPAIEVRGLRKTFEKKEAVAGIDLDIAAGSLAGLVGPNGAGKTTTLSMMTGLLRPDAGRIVIKGLDVCGQPGRRHLGSAANRLPGPRFRGDSAGQRRPGCSESRERLDTRLIMILLLDPGFSGIF